MGWRTLMKQYSDKPRQRMRDLYQEGYIVYTKLRDILSCIYYKYCFTIINARSYFLKSKSESTLIDKQHLAEELVDLLRIVEVEFIDRNVMLQINVSFDMDVFTLDTQEFLDNLDKVYVVYKLDGFEKEAQIATVLTSVVADKLLDDINIELWTYLSSPALHYRNTIRFFNIKSDFLYYDYANFMAIQKQLKLPLEAMTDATLVIGFQSYNKFVKRNLGELHNLKKEFILDIVVTYEDLQEKVNIEGLVCSLNTLNLFDRNFMVPVHILLRFESLNRNEINDEVLGLFNHSGVSLYTKAEDINLV